MELQPLSNNQWTDYCKGVKSLLQPTLMILFFFSSGWKEHLVHLQIVLTRLQSAGLTVKLKKSKFAYTSCEYLGHNVGIGVIKPVMDKVEAVHAFPRPEIRQQ